MAVPVMDPYSAVLGTALGATRAAPAGPSEARSSGTIGGSMFDSSGMNINFGSGGITAQRSQETGDPLQTYMPYVVIGVGFLLVWRFLKTKKS